MKPKAIGTVAERELARKLWEAGFAVIRAPSSGSGARRIFYPDIVALYHGRIFVFEVKKRKKLEPIYIERNKLVNLLEFSARAYGNAFLAVKITQNNLWKIIELNYKLLEEAGKAVKISSEELMKAKTLTEFIRNVTNKDITIYFRRYK